MKQKKMKRKAIFIISVLIFSFVASIVPEYLNAQTKHQHDSTYYVDFPHTLTTRILLSRKYTSVTLPSANDGSTDLKYKPNEKMSLGVGFAYNNLSLNVGASLGLLNPDKGKGDTKSLALQLHLNPHKWEI